MRVENGAGIPVEEDVLLHALIAGMRLDEIQDLVKLTGRRMA
jgi:hypothetical protein